MYDTGSPFQVCSIFFLLTHSPFFLPSLHPHSPPPTPTLSTSPPSHPQFLLLPLRASLAQGDRSAAPLVCYCPHGNHLLPPLPLSHQLISLKHTHVGKHAHTLRPPHTHAHISYAIQSLALALAGLVCSTHPCEWYLESPCPAPISVPPSCGVDVSRLGVVPAAKARHWPEPTPSLPVNSLLESLSRHLPGLLP